MALEAAHKESAPLLFERVRQRSGDAASVPPAEPRGAGRAPAASACPGAGGACSKAGDALGPAGGMADGFSTRCSWDGTPVLQWVPFQV